MVVHRPEILQGRTQPPFGNKLRAIIPDNPGALSRHLLQDYGSSLLSIDPAYTDPAPGGPFKDRKSQKQSQENTGAHSLTNTSGQHAALHPAKLLRELPALTRLGPLPAMEPAMMNLVALTYLG